MFTFIVEGWYSRIRFKDVVQFQVSRVSIGFTLNLVFEDKFKLMFLKVNFQVQGLKVSIIFEVSC